MGETKPLASYSLYSDFNWYELGDMISIGNNGIQYYCFPTITGDYGACHINEVITGKNTSRLFLDNEEYWYATPTVHTGRKIKKLYYVTKPECYPINRPDERSFSIRVPGFGMDIIEIEYEDEA